MCLKGGPRCQTHAKADAQKASEKVREQTVETYLLEETNNKAITQREAYTGHDSKKISSLDKQVAVSGQKLQQGVEKSAVLIDKANALSKASNATAGGIVQLEQQVKELEKSGNDSSIMRADLAEARENYAHNLKEYDKRNGTVDARKPSPHSDFEGIEDLSERLKKSEAKLDELEGQKFVDGSSPELEKKIEDASLASVRLRNQLDHAYNTANHRRQGIIPPLEKKRPEPGSQAARVDDALASSLDYGGVKPRWIRKMEQESKKTWGGSEHPRIIDVIDSPAGKLAVVWSPRSLVENDSSIQEERGFVVCETSFVSMKTGEKLGYLKASYTDDKSLSKSFGSDEWSSLAYMDEYSGSSMGIKVYKEIEPVTITDKFGRSRTKKTKTVHAINDASTPTEILQAKRHIWAKSHSALRLNPESMEKENKYIPYYNLSAKDAPISEAELDKDLKTVKSVADKEYANFKSDYKTPYVDFSRAEEKIRGTGLGSALYVYSARMLGKDNRILRGSGVQSDDATGVWTRFTSNSKLPVKKLTWNHSKAGKKESYALDFREISK